MVPGEWRNLTSAHEALSIVDDEKRQGQRRVVDALAAHFERARAREEAITSRDMAEGNEEHGMREEDEDEDEEEEDESGGRGSRGSRGSRDRHRRSHGSDDDSVASGADMMPASAMCCFYTPAQWMAMSCSRWHSGDSGAGGQPVKERKNERKKERKKERPSSPSSPPSPPAGVDSHRGRPARRRARAAARDRARGTLVMMTWRVRISSLNN